VKLRNNENKVIHITENPAPGVRPMSFHEIQGQIKDQIKPFTDKIFLDKS
jgi:hypothetical protein